MTAASALSHRTSRLVTVHSLLILAGVCLMFRFGFRVHAENDNIFYYTYWLEALGQWSSHHDLITQVDYSTKSYFVPLLSPVMRLFGILQGSFVLVLASLSAYLISTYWLCRRFGLRSLACGAVIVMASGLDAVLSPDGTRLLEPDLTPRTVSVVLSMVGLVFVLFGQFAIGGLFSGLSAGFQFPSSVGGILLCLSWIIALGLGQRERQLRAIALWSAGAIVGFAPLLLLGIHGAVRTALSHSDAWWRAVEFRQDYLFLAHWGNNNILEASLPMVALPFFVLANRRYLESEFARFLTWSIALISGYFLAIVIARTVFRLPLALAMVPGRAYQLLFIVLLVAAVAVLQERRRVGQIERLGFWSFVLVGGVSILYRDLAVAGAMTFVFTVYLILRDRMARTPHSAGPVRAMASSFIVLSMLTVTVYRLYPFDAGVSALLQGLIGRYGLTVEPYLEKSHFVDPERYRALPKLPFERQEILNYIRTHAEPADMMALPSAQSVTTFPDARVWAERGVFWDYKTGGAAYYSSDAFVSAWLERLRINDAFFSEPVARSEQSGLNEWRRDNALRVRPEKEMRKRLDLLLRLAAPPGAPLSFEDAAIVLHEHDVRWVVRDGPFPRLHPYLREVLRADGYFLYRLSIP